MKRIQQRLIDETHVTAKYREFTILDRDKEREICDLPYYPDRIVHWAVMLQVEPIIVSTFINTSYAAIPGRGAHLALTRIVNDINNDVQGTQYCLKLDVHKYFPSIDHDILMAQLKRKIKCKSTLAFFRELIESYHSKLTGRGVPIGNYPSQYFGNFYLTPFDHWLKETTFLFKNKEGKLENRKVHYYYRYMDDMIILSDSKEFLHYLRKRIDKYLQKHLNVWLKDNYQVFPVDIRGIDFMGYRTFRNYILLRNGTKRRLNRAARDIKKNISRRGYITAHERSVLASYNGILKWCNGKRLYWKNIWRLEKYFDIIEDEIGYEAFAL